MKTPLLLALLLASSVSATDARWPRFRGPDGTGVAEDAKPPAEFGPGKNVRWQVDVPSGLSSPCVWGDRLFLTAFDGGKLWTLCHDTKTGRELWRRDAGAEKIEAFLAGQGSPAASTATTDGERVVVYFGSCGLIAYDFDGKELWRHSLPVAETNNGFGTGTSPIIEEGLVILVRDLRQDSTVMALDVKTGRLAWKTARPGMGTGYSTPVVWKHDGLKELIAPGALMLKAYDLQSGSERWLVRELPAVNCSSPVASAGMLFLAGWSPAGEDAPMPDYKQLLAGDTDHDGKISEPESEKTFLKGFFAPNDGDKNGFITQAEWDGLVAYLKSGTNRLIAVKSGGSGDITASHVAWEKKKGLPYVPSALLYHDNLFIVKDGGLASCFDARNGSPHYEQERVGISGSFYASPVAANGHLYLLSLNGKAATLAAGDKLKVVWQTDFKETTAATPAIAGDTLFVRTATKLYAFGKGQ